MLPIFQDVYQQFRTILHRGDLKRADFQICRLYAGDNVGQFEILNGFPIASQRIFNLLLKLKIKGLDGLTDVGEFKAGTDPTNQGSILRVTTIRAVDAGRKTIVWSSIPGKTYRLEFKRGLTDSSWTPLPSSVVAQDETTSAEDARPAESERFYRVVLVP